MDLDLTDGWITLSRYCKETGETKQTVHLRVSRGKWIRGVHYTVPDGGGAWVNIVAIRKWLLDNMESQKPAPPPYVPVEPAHLIKPAEEVGTTAPTTFAAWIPALMQDDEAAPPIYANLTGMDMPLGRVLGPYTKVAKSARQFLTDKECDFWCTDNSNDKDMWFTVCVELPYA